MSYLTSEQTAEYLGYSVHSLLMWRQKGTGPRYVKVMGRSIRYKKSDIEQWMKKCCQVVHTDQQPAPRVRLRITDEEFESAV